MTVGSDRADGRAQRKDRRAAAKGDHGELPHLRRTEADPSSPSLESAANAKWAGEGNSAAGYVFALDPKRGSFLVQFAFDGVGTYGRRLIHRNRSASILTSS